MGEMPPHVAIVFRELFEHLRSMKQQQWTITNYAAAILAAIYVMKLAGVSHSQTYLKMLAWVTAVVGSVMLLWVQRNMAVARLRLDDVHDNFFTSNELRAVGWTNKQIGGLRAKLWRRKFAYWCSGLEFTVPLIVLLGGAVLVCLVL